MAGYLSTHPLPPMTGGNHPNAGNRPHQPRFSVGQRIAVFEVVEYLGRQARTQEGPRHYYKVRCVRCGAIHERQQSGLVGGKSARARPCKSCPPTEAEKARANAGNANRGKVKLAPTEDEVWWANQWAPPSCT